MSSQLNQKKIIGPILRKVDTDIEKRGYQEAMMTVLNRCGTLLTVTHEEQSINRTLKKSPVLIVGNHPAECDVLALLASIHYRDDFYLIINSSFLNILKSLDKHLIPVYISHRLLRKDKPNLRLRLFKKIHSSKEIDQEEAHKRNIESINTAAKKLTEGGMVAIFPGGGGDKGKWLPGVGYLAKETVRHSDAYVIKAYIEGTSDFDYLRIIPFVSKILPPFKVTFSKPMKLSQLRDLEAKEIALTLEDDYNRWVEKIPKNISLAKRTINLVPKFPKQSYLLLRTFFIWFLTQVR